MFSSQNISILRANKLFIRETIDTKIYKIFVEVAEHCEKSSLALKIPSKREN